MSENTPEAIDAWRKDEAHRIVNSRSHQPQPIFADYEVYRRLVRENVLPPAEPIGNDLPKWAQDEAARLALAEPAPKWGVHDSPRSHYALARLIAKQGKPEVAEPDQDTLDTRAVLMAWYSDTADEFREEWTKALNRGQDEAAEGFIAAKQALTEIKARVRREAIMALPDECMELAKALYKTHPDGGAQTKLTGTTGTRSDWTRVWVADAWEDACDANRAQSMTEAAVALAAIKSVYGK